MIYRAVKTYSQQKKCYTFWEFYPMQPMNNVTMLDPPFGFAQLNLDSPQLVLYPMGYRVWGVKVTLGYEGKRSSYRARERSR